MRALSDLEVSKVSGGNSITGYEGITAILLARYGENNISTIEDVVDSWSMFAEVNAYSVGGPDDGNGEGELHLLQSMDQAFMDDNSDDLFLIVNDNAIQVWNSQELIDEYDMDQSGEVSPPADMLEMDTVVVTAGSLSTDQNMFSAFVSSIESMMGQVAQQGEPSCSAMRDFEENNFVDLIRDIINEIPSSADQEWGATLGYNEVSGFFAVGDAIFTNNSDGEVELSYFVNASQDVYGSVHNHPYNAFSNNDERLLNRYPSDNDWVSADVMVSNGADPNNFSLFIVDPWGVLREYKYSDKSLYKGMSQSDLIQGNNLPTEIIDDDAERLAGAPGCS